MKQRCGGPYPHLRLDLAVKVEQGIRIHQLVSAGHSFRQAADITGWSLTTCWRRYHFLEDWLLLPRFYGKKPKGIPPQRGTRACPSGRPWIAAIDERRWR